jgi:membrane associated rhomboid family serine protease
VIPISDRHPTRRTPVVTWTVLGLCVVAFLWQVTGGGDSFERSIYTLGLIPAVLTGRAVLPPELAVVPAPATIFTSMFLHGGFLHLAGNLLYLWVFGDNVEDRFGRGGYLVFYLACGVVAAFAQVLPEPGSPVPMIGASGAISGVLGAYLLLYPHRRIEVIVPVVIIPYRMVLPAVVVLGLWFVMQLIASLGAPQGEGGVAFRAHIGGFVAGLALTPLMSRLRPA